MKNPLWKKSTTFVRAATHLERKADESLHPDYNNRVEEPPDDPPPAQRQDSNLYNSPPPTTPYGYQAPPVGNYTNSTYNDQQRGNITFGQQPYTQSPPPQPYADQQWQSQNSYQPPVYYQQPTYQSGHPYAQPSMPYSQQTQYGTPPTNAQYNTTAPSYGNVYGTSSSPPHLQGSPPQLQSSPPQESPPPMQYQYSNTDTQSQYSSLSPPARVLTYPVRSPSPGLANQRTWTMPTDSASGGKWCKHNNYLGGGLGCPYCIGGS